LTRPDTGRAGARDGAYAVPVTPRTGDGGGATLGAGLTAGRGGGAGLGLATGRGGGAGFGRTGAPNATGPLGGANGGI